MEYVDPPAHLRVETALARTHCRLNRKQECCEGPGKTCPSIYFSVHQDIFTWPVLSKPIARAAAGDKSIFLPRTHGPLSLILTVTQPL